jgi:hypothetical protein
MTPESTLAAAEALRAKGFTVIYDPILGSSDDWQVEWNTICTKGESPIVKPCHEWFADAELEQLARSIGWQGEGE